LTNVRDLSEGNLRSICSGDQDASNILRITPELGSVTHTYRKTAASFNGRSDVVFADCRLDYVLNGAYINAVAGGLLALRLDVQIESAVTCSA